MIRDGAGTSGRPLWPAILLSWGLASAILLAVTAHAILALQFPDPDDAMRLLEARDLLAGQSWWDVSQHRLASGLMHWSRIVDLPIVAVMAIVRPFAGPIVAERTAMVVVPLMTLGVVMALIAHLTRRLLDGEHARMALLVTPLSVPILNQLRPMRIDHHGWQVALAVGAVVPLLRPGRNWKDGAFSGCVIAALLTISLEGLPIAAAILGVVGLRWLLDVQQGGRFLGAIWAAALGSALLHLATRGPDFLVLACDAQSPTWIAILGAAAIGATVAVRLGAHSFATRTTLSVATIVACVVVLFAIDPTCMAGPFGSLEPLVRSLWYERINEGLPIWRQFPVWMALCVGLPIVGVAGSIFALRSVPADQRSGWWIMLGLLVAAFALSLLVNRAAATANVFAVPGAAYVLTALLGRARQLPDALLRTLATAGALLAAAPGSAAILFLGMPDDAGVRNDPTPGARPTCARVDDVQGLGLLPPARLFAPLDMTPAILAKTDYTAITSGHHRNAAAMTDVMRAFTASPKAAHIIIAKYAADYVVGCPGIAEPTLYDSVAPNGFWARLERGERFDWLTPVAIPGSPILVWRVNDPSHRTKRPLS